MSAAALIRQAEFEQDVKDEEVKSQMMAARPSIADLKKEASKTPSKAEIRAIAAKAAGVAPPAPEKPAGLFDFFSLDQGASGGDIFEPRDPNALTAKEESAFSAPPVKAPFGSRKVAASAPAPAPAPVEKVAAPAGGLFGFMNQGPAAPVKAAPVIVKAAPVVVAKKVATPAPAPEKPKPKTD